MKIQSGFIISIIFIFLIAFSTITSLAQERYADYVNPFIGTHKMGHTFPGACVPFGMVQLSPDTDTIAYELNGGYNPKAYEYCAGYQYADSSIVGFSHTHFSGTGHSDLGDILIMPCSGDIKLNPGTSDNTKNGYRSLFSHEYEKAEPAYYQVKLLDYNINAELTCSSRVGFHKYCFQQGDNAHIILDLMHGIYNYEGKNTWTFLRVENDTLICGYRQCNGWARTRKLFFAISFDKAITSYGHKKYDSGIYKGFYRKFDEEHNFPEMAGENIRAWFCFDIKDGDSLKIKVALSSVSTEGALKNLTSEIPHWDFNKIRKQGKEKWEKELSKIQIESLCKNDKVTFYTALYHCFISPIIFMDVDGRYRGLDQNIHHSKAFTNYSIFSLWDTFRALHPLYNLIQAERNSDMISSMLGHYDQSVHPMLPVWSHYANENWCMTGYHSVSVIADAVIKGVFKGDIDRALQACSKTASYPLFDGLDYYMKYDYVPDDKNSYSVSKTLEYAYDDWCISQIAKKTGNDSLDIVFSKRAANYKRVFNTENGFMQPKLANGNFRKNFDPLDTHGQGFIEGNAYNYGLYVPHEPEQLISMMGGKNKFEKFLDTLFNGHLDDKHIEKNEDITREGIMGLYVHGNEPGHHIPYLYVYTESPSKTQVRVREIMQQMYSNANNGLCGNDDCGQMSAWYVFSALGFYPICPGSNEYLIGSPLVKKAKLRLSNGNTLIITTQNQGRENVFVDKIFFNGNEIKDYRLNHYQLMKGGELVFYMK